MKAAATDQSFYLRFALKLASQSRGPPRGSLEAFHTFSFCALFLFGGGGLKRRTSHAAGLLSRFYMTRLPQNACFLLFSSAHFGFLLFRFLCFFLQRYNTMV